MQYVKDFDSKKRVLDRLGYDIQNMSDKEILEFYEMEYLAEISEVEDQWD
jgi:hypothetical protein